MHSGGWVFSGAKKEVEDPAHAPQMLPRLLKQTVSPGLVINEMKLGDLNRHAFHIILVCLLTIPACDQIRHHVEKLRWPKTGLNDPCLWKCLNIFRLLWNCVVTIQHDSVPQASGVFREKRPVVDIYRASVWASTVSQANTLSSLPPTVFFGGERKAALPCGIVSSFPKFNSLCDTGTLMSLWPLKFSMRPQRSTVATGLKRKKEGQCKQVVIWINTHLGCFISPL